MSVPITLSDIERRDARDQIFRRTALITLGTVWSRTTKFGRRTHVRRGIFSRGQPRPHRKAAVPQRCQILGILAIYAYTLCHRTTKFDAVTHMGRGLFQGSATFLPQGAIEAPALSNFGDPFYLFSLWQKYQIWRGNTCEGACVLGSATPPIPINRVEFQGSPIWGFSYIYAYTV